MSLYSGYVEALYRLKVYVSGGRVCMVGAGGRGVVAAHPLALPESVTMKEAAPSV